MTEKITLNNGLELPCIALGTYQSLGSKLDLAVASAIDCGYTSFDCAAYYQNEAALAQALQKTAEKRQDIFVTTKLWVKDHGYDSALRAFDESEKNLGKIDVYLIHWPCGERFIPSWKALERIYEEKRVKAIGVSNFLPSHLDLLEQNANVPPAINQIEAHPFNMDWETIEKCQNNGITVEAWRPLMKGNAELLSNPLIQEIASELNKSTAQIIIRFLLQSGLRVLAKSVTPVRIAENIDVFDFELSDSHMLKMRSLKRDDIHTDRSPDSMF